MNSFEPYFVFVFFLNLAWSDMTSDKRSVAHKDKMVWLSSAKLFV